MVERADGLAFGDRHLSCDVLADVDASFFGVSSGWEGSWLGVGLEVGVLVEAGFLGAHFRQILLTQTTIPTSLTITPHYFIYFLLFLHHPPLSFLHIISDYFWRRLTVHRLPS